MLFTETDFIKNSGVKCMSNSYVVEGAELKCSFGDASSNLQIPTPRYTLIKGKKEATIDDYQPKKYLV
jgi:hypothetical protein